MAKLTPQQLFNAPAHVRTEAQGLDPATALLRVWQSERLSKTYADLLDVPDYAPACRYFLNDLYAARDFSQRDHDTERIHHLLGQVMPPVIERSLADIIALNQMSHALDAQLVSVLVGQLGVTEAISTAQYCQAYRICDNQDARAAQIALLSKLVREVGALAQQNMVSWSLKVIKGPAVRLGWGELFGFLERGYDAFRKMRDASAFAAIVEEREGAILTRIFAGEDDPF
ncbi:MAG: hypothetical protein JNL42_10305 [Anaerolineae bacterium]|nr:hypothetical protein [Anaerolineae bacterium]